MPRTPQLLQIAQLGHPVLREKSRELTRDEIRTDHIKRLIDDMIATCLDVDGAGLAAPQVYQPIRLFIVASHPSERYPNAPQMEPTAMINPFIQSASDGSEKDWEGCLSIPGIRAIVQRAKSVEVAYTDRYGKDQAQMFEGFVARVFQHEFDHLDGVVITDRADRKDIVMEKEFRKILQAKKKV